MKKVLLCALFVIAAVGLTSVSVSAAESDENKFWEEYLEAVPEGSVGADTEDVISGVGIDSLLSELIHAVGVGAGSAASFLVMLLGVAVLIALSDTLGQDSGTLSSHASVGITVIAAVLIFGRLGEVIFSVSESLRELSVFFSAIIPVLSGILLAGGNVNSSAYQAFNMNVTLSAVSYISNTLLIPLVFAMFALALMASLEGGRISSVSKSLKGAFMWVMGIGTTVVIGAVTMQSIIAGAKDSAYLRAAKYAASGMIPVVGNVVSSALSTMAGGMIYVKSAVGVSAVMVIVGLALAPLITLLLYRFSLSLSISFLDFMGSSGGVRSFSAFRSALDCLISVYALSCVIYISEIVVFIKSGVNAFG